jgi:hypothetical protein
MAVIERRGRVDAMTPPDAARPTEIGSKPHLTQTAQAGVQPGA